MITLPLRDTSHRIFWIGLNIGDMNRLAFQQNASGDRAAIRFDRTVFHALLKLGRDAVACDVKKTHPLRTANGRHVRIAQTRDRFDQRVKHRLQIEGRTADDFQHFGRRGLLLERFAKFAGALLLGLEQPHVLDRDRRLIGESRQQRDMLLLEWPHVSAAYCNGAERVALADQRHAENRVMAKPLRHMLTEGKFITGMLHVYDMDRLHSDNSSPRDRRTIQWKRLINRPTNLAEASNNAQHVTLDNENIRILCLADAGRMLGDRIEHRPDVIWRI